MAMLVVIEFDDNEEAEKFVHSPTHLVSSPRSPSPHNVDVSRVVGMFKKPTMFCHCLDVGKKHGGYTRGIRNGWWVHYTCKKPTQGWGGSFRAVIGQGRNLIDDEMPGQGVTPKMIRTNAEI